MNVKLMLGDNIESLRKLEDNSIDSVVTDPPYGLSFMNKKWDYDVPSVKFWKEVHRVLKPGGHVLSFGGTRTYHRMVVNIEDAGFEIRDQIMWLYGSGFPKSHNIGKAVDKLQGNEREVLYQKNGLVKSKSEIIKWNTDLTPNVKQVIDETKGQSEWEGWGTALKPANEPICLARKPLSEKSVAENVLKWGTGGINIDGCRVEGAYGTGQNEVIEGKQSGVMYHNYDGDTKPATGHKQKVMVSNPEGRFPANIILECLCDEVIKGEKGEVKRSGSRDRTKHDYNSVGNFGSKEGSILAPDNYNDKGDIHTNPMCPCSIMDEQSSSASRFFYQAKVSKAERNMGLDEFEDVRIKTNISGLDDKPRIDGTIRETPVRKNTHPTVKPINLMTYLCRLITPEGGIVLDPFMGSGSTGISARLEGFQFIGMEMDEDYYKIAEARINSYREYKKFTKK